MTLKEAIQEYIAYRRAHGAKFESSAGVLHRFANSIDGEIGCEAVNGDQVRVFLSGTGHLTRYRANKYGALSGFYRYAVSRDYASSSPLPHNEPRRPASALPYVYSHDELRRLFDALHAKRRRGTKLDKDTFRTLLLLLYGTGLRPGEARRLTLGDVDLSAAILTIRDTKFYKSRLVPVGSQLAHAVDKYTTLRVNRPLLHGNDSSLLANTDGTALQKGTVQRAFAELVRVSGIYCSDSMRRSPGLHSFRHTFAVHRLTSWYRQGADLQQLLPQLSTYLGHTELAGTQVYLSMTPELLQQASLRFERYAKGGENE